MFVYLKHLIVLLFMTVFVYSDITGFAFKDFNGDGIQQSGEPGIEGIIVKAYRDGQLEKNTTTGSDGNYFRAI